MISEENSYRMHDSLDQAQQHDQLQNLASKYLQKSLIVNSNCRFCKKGTCQLHRIQTAKIPLKPFKSTYKQSYQKQLNIENIKFRVPQHRNNYSTIIQDSSYRSQFNKGNIEESLVSGKKKDSINFNGPLYAQSSYMRSYPTIESVPSKQQYIINPNMISRLDKLKLSGCSSYKDSYKGGINIRQGPLKRQGSLKLSKASFQGNSSYLDQFMNTNNMIKNESFKPKNYYVPTPSMKVESSYKSQYHTINPQDLYD